MQALDLVGDLVGHTERVSASCAPFIPSIFATLLFSTPGLALAGAEHAFMFPFTAELEFPGSQLTACQRLTAHSRLARIHLMELVLCSFLPGLGDSCLE